MNAPSAHDEWTPCMFTHAQVAEIEEAWQIAIAVMGHFDLNDIVKSLDDLGSYNEEEEELDDDSLVRLSPTERLQTCEGYEDCNAIAQEAVRRDVRAIVWASDRLRNCAYLWLPVIRRDASLVRYLPKKWREDADFCLQAVRANPAALHYIARHLCYRPKILQAAWQEGPILYNTRQSFVPLFFDGNDESTTTGDLLRYAVVELDLNHEEARSVAKQHDSLRSFDRYKNDMEIVAAVTVRQTGRHYNHATTTDLFTSTKKMLPLRPPNRVRLGSNPSPWGRGRHVRKLSETQ